MNIKSMVARLITHFAKLLPRNCIVTLTIGMSMTLSGGFAGCTPDPSPKTRKLSHTSKDWDEHWETQDKQQNEVSQYRKHLDAQHDKSGVPF